MIVSALKFENFISICIIYSIGMMGFDWRLLK